MNKKLVWPSQTKVEVIQQNKFCEDLTSNPQKPVLEKNKHNIGLSESNNPKMITSNVSEKTYTPEDARDTQESAEDTRESAEDTRESAEEDTQENAEDTPVSERADVALNLNQTSFHTESERVEDTSGDAKIRKKIEVTEDIQTKFEGTQQMRSSQLKKSKKVEQKRRLKRNYEKE